MGSGKVVHYTGLAPGLHGGPVEEVSLAYFTYSRPAEVTTGRLPGHIGQSGLFFAPTAQNQWGQRQFSPVGPVQAVAVRLGVNRY